jgi:hypothetical protein
LAIVFGSLFFFSNFDIPNDILYFENGYDYKFQSSKKLKVVDSQIQLVETQEYVDYQQNLQTCKQQAQNEPAISCESKFGNNRFANTTTQKIYLYSHISQSSQEIDLATAQKLILIPEKKLVTGHDISNSSCSYSGSYIFSPGYSSDCKSKLTIRKGWQAKDIDLELGTNSSRYSVGNEDRNFYWIKK